MTEYGERVCRGCGGTYFTWESYTNDTLCADCSPPKERKTVPEMIAEIRELLAEKDAKK